MKKQAIIQENGIDWYVSQNPIERYLKVDRINNQSISKSVRINSKGHSYRQKKKKNRSS